jgi:hypothetical protein
VTADDDFDAGASSSLASTVSVHSARAIVNATHRENLRIDASCVLRYQQTYDRIVSQLSAVGEADVNILEQ